MDTKNIQKLYKRYDPYSTVENEQSRKASINNENYNIQSQGTDDKK